ncbi:MAG: GUN4 domain-containing protein [Scytonematopsis contorta HA4267-MV1]|jgi:hypothetical protein|nr:GUN4 domain-containing protein [Scytonematopsis contorta HA4267-MV1]
MTDPMIVSGKSSDIESLRQPLIAGSEKVQQQVIPQLVNFGNGGLDVLIEFLYERRDKNATLVDGKVYQTLFNSEYPKAKEFLQNYFPAGIVPLKSECGTDYSPLQQLLVAGDFEAADRMTLQKMCEIASPVAAQRKWLYFTDVASLPVTDLKTINNLWVMHSEGKFGFSVQREIWLGLGKNWENLWTKIGWKQGNNWTRYPNEFIWNLDAPRGHLPLSNQLRGVRVISSLFSHPVWD